MIDKLYKEFAEYYAKIASDRNYKDHLDIILESYEPEHQCHTLLELFAGQALHSINASKRNSIDVWAIDSSAELRQVALVNGFKNQGQYLVGHLPEAILDYVGKVKFDCIICLSLSIAHLNKKSVYELLYNIKEVLNEKGKVFIEVDDIRAIMEYLQSGAPISYYEVQDTNGDHIKYAWPSNKMKFNHYSHTAEVPVKVIIESTTGTESMEFISEENMYGADDILFIADLLGYNGRILSKEDQWAKAFENTVVIELSHN
ncbi:class I SAM-dependent methyltransferase [Pedobacter sp. L105]|uniref:class I SAM-dependent methyltransferase n=1 Tax=Pedobacter sp. L105 TaxID=1641871 RepID=UPI00131C4C38|nr:hypothetical protein [Pedobacter sp. L105]